VSGPAAGGTTVTISGAEFHNGTNVTFGGTDAVNVTFVSGTSLTCDTPAHAAGAVDVKVTNPDSQAGILANGFIFDPPPTLTGTDFVSGATVTFGGTAATGVTFVSSTSMTCSTPSAGTEGAVDVQVTNPDSQAGTLANGFTYYMTLIVTNIDPYDGQTNVNINDPIVLTFNTNVDPTTVSSFTVRILDHQGQSPAGVYTVSTNTVTFTPQYPPGLSVFTTYSVVVHAPPTSPVIMTSSGGPLTSLYTSTFSTGSNITPDVTGPTVLSVTPADNATSVSRDTNITITFSEPIDQSTIMAGFSLIDQSSPTTPLSGLRTLSKDQTVLYFDPEPGAPFPDYLKASNHYTVLITSSIRDMAGNPLMGAPWQSSFGTGTTPSAASLRGPLTENFTDNTYEDAAQTTAEWNTAVAGALVTEVQPQSLLETDPSPTGNPSNSIQGPWETSSCRVAVVIPTGWLTLGSSQISGKRITRLYWKHSGAFTPATYTNLVVRIGHTTLGSFPTSPSPGATFSSLYMQSTTQVDPEVVTRLSTYTASSTTGPGGSYVEIPIVGNFVYNGTDNIIIDIEVLGGSAQNLCTGDDQASAGSPVVCRAYDSTGAYDTIEGTVPKVPHFLLEFGGHSGAAGLDGAGNSMTAIAAPLGSGNDIYVTMSATIDTSLASMGYGHLKVNSLYVAQGAVLNIIGPNPCIIRASALVRINGTIRANGSPGALGASMAGGAGGTGGPGGGPGGTGGAGAAAGSGSAGLPATGLDAQSGQAQGAGQGGGGGAAGAGGGGGACALAGSQGITAGASSGGAGGLVWGNPSSLFLQGGAGGGGGGGGTGASSGGGGGGGGGGYIQILCDRNISIGSNAFVEARGAVAAGAGSLAFGGGGGGGAGGCVLFSGINLTFTGSGGTLFNVQGNAGGGASAGGSGGPQTTPPYNHVLADGRIRFDATIANQSNATFVPSVTIQSGQALSGTYLASATSVATSTFYDTGCSAPQYTNATISYTSIASPPTSVSINFIGAVPDILSQPNVSISQLYAIAETLPVGLPTATVTLGGTQAGYINGAAASQSGASLNGLRFIRFVVDLFSSSATHTPQVTQISIQYQY
jgi:hypothetical protein